MFVKSVSPTRLCPSCANSIAEDIVTCPYCKADVSAVGTPQWPTREEEALEKTLTANRQRIATRSKIILIAGIVVFAVGVFLIGGQSERSESQLLLEEKLKDLKTRDQKIQALEGELAQARKELAENSNQITELKTQLEESRRDLATTRERLTAATREAERLASSRAQAGVRKAPPPVEKASSPPAPARRAAEPGDYETIRATSVYAEPSGSARVVSQISKGTKVTVVRSVGDWLEVRSRHGNPPGFIRWGDAMFISKAK